MAGEVYYPVEGDTLPHHFDSFDSAGASVTLSGLAVTDIEIYKDGSVTQRASDNGYTLLDTDGIDFDGVTGIHGFSIDLSDNSDSGFYSVGPWYTVVVSSVTIDGQTVSFIACRFRIVSATRGLAGTALPADAADAPGGLPISDAGGLDLDTLLGYLTGAVATATALATAQTDLDTLTGTDGVTLATSQGNYAPAKANDQMDLVNAPNATAVTAIQSGLATLTKLLKYVQLLARSDAAIETDNATELTAINADGGSGAGDYSAQTDAGEALRDHIGDGTNLSALAQASVCTEARLAELDAGNLPTDVAAVLTAIGNLNDVSVSDIWTTVLTEAYRATGAEGTAAQLMYEILQNITQFACAGTTKTVKKLDGVTTAKTYQLNDEDTPTSISELT